MDLATLDVKKWNAGFPLMSGVETGSDRTKW